MHIRVLLSKYRSYTECPSCHGARLKPDALLWRLGGHSAAHDKGLAIHELMQLPIEESRRFIDALKLPGALDQASDLVLAEVRSRLGYLCDVGLPYLTLDRQSRTLSGGEVQRINLTTALGTSLVNTLFVLDEPSIGLHPRDMGRVIAVMQRLRDIGNSLIVVEHDPQIMAQADRILDLGPGAGEHGGNIVSYGTPAQVAADKKSLTGAWLSGRRWLPPLRATAAAPARGQIELAGVDAHNLKHINVSIPLGQLVCLTGVSGSGKSTLVEHVLYPALQQAKGRAAAAPLGHARLSGAELIEDVLLIDQSPVGRTTRSNPVSYVGAFEPIRKLFAASADARLRRYTAGTFSFNSGNGRCPVCSGNGFEHIEMQFLADVYLRCGSCQGRRYRSETLQVRINRAGRSASIADVLDMTVTEALAFFAAEEKIAAVLQPLADVGLEYLRLGQPVPTLSGGEAQRLKLAKHLAEAALPSRRRGRGEPALGKLLLFDEPTTGLHFEDIARLLGALRQLLEAGHSLLIIEHNLDLIAAADWLIDLGPEGGAGGGRVIFTGTPQQAMREANSHTGQALARQARATPAQPAPLAAVAEPAPPTRRAARGQIRIRGVREHNLKNLNVDIPRDRFTVITGVSGSGKSTLAFDVLFNEGQRRYLESLNAYARQFVQPAARPDLDSITGIAPTVAIEQRTSRGGLKSTVATLTEIYHFLRLLYVKTGVQYCPDCHVAIAPQTETGIAAEISRHYRGRRVQLLAPLVGQRKGIYTDLARWAAARGARKLRVDGKLVPTEPFPPLKRFVDHTIELPISELTVNAAGQAALREAIAAALEAGRGVLHVLDAAGAIKVYSARRSCPSCSRGFPEPDPRLLSFNSAQGWCEACHGTGVALAGFSGEESGEEQKWTEAAEHGAKICASCNGARLNPVALNIRLAGRSIAAITALPVNALQKLLGRLKLKAREATIARDALAEIGSRLQFLDRVGLGYLTLDRAAPTLSGGEAQRIRLAAQLGSNLQGVCYVLDEPTIGLHPRDNHILLEALSSLTAARNTLVVVEHDEDTIRRADHIVDLGPGAGIHGGLVIASGTAAQLQRNPASVTGRYLARPLKHAAVPRRAVNRNSPALTLHDVRLHNLRNLQVRIPLGRLVVITGVSGSGKSSLTRD
ncbi:MAG TPA: hypothetical protein VKG66_03770, partial [Steroidobacteraceae bacterium]|nr:hypothetical protein [Steroidobacteraceae bacterium]